MREVIQTQPALAALLPKVQRNDWIAIDTEADSLHAYPEKLCLIQLSLPEADILVDPLADLNLRPLFEALHSKELILHGADYDLRLLHRTFAFVPTAIFDTMWAARLLGYREFGLRFLVQKHLAVGLEKGPQKMNWALRPLPERMATYALNDTRFLRPLADLLRAELQSKGRLVWLEEVGSRVIRESSQVKSSDPNELWRIRGSDRLDRPAMAVLVELWQWRQEEAISANKPPYFILSHESLIAIAAAVAHGRPVQNLVPPHFSSKRAARLAIAIERGLKVHPSKFPQPRRSSGVRLSKVQQTRFDELKTIRDARALELDLDPTVIASKAELVVLAQDSVKGASDLMGWQRQLLGLTG